MVKRKEELVPKKQKYDYWVIWTLAHNIDREIKRAEKDGWETNGQMCVYSTKTGSGYFLNAAQPMRRKIKPKQDV